MRKEDVPQDDMEYYEGRVRACYAQDMAGQFVKTGSSGWYVEEYFNSRALEEIELETSDVQDRVLKGALSPLAFHMVSKQMTPSLLAEHVGFCKWRVLRHLKPRGFNKLREKDLEKYAAVLSVTRAELNNVP